MPSAAVRVCKQCRRLNPSEAVYCYHDGVRLDLSDGAPAAGRAIDVGRQPFSTPFVLPSGRECRNHNELALACHADPKAAFELLRTGHLESFLAAQGRADLARAARRAARAADRLRGVDEFLGRLPAAGLLPARLRVVPGVLALGRMHPGEERRCELTLTNDGMRLLTGSASCDVPWLSLADGAEVQGRLFEFTKHMVLPVRVVGRELRAFEKPHEGVIQVESNGGKIVVGVRVFMPVKPFPEGVLSGALSPRQAAHKAKDAPKETAALIESGALACWYESNGWTYPVLGQTASGVAAVQQFLEALGLVKPPKVEVSEDTVRLHGLPGAKIEYSLAVITPENRNAVAFGTTDQPWLWFGKTVFRGRSAFLPLTIPAVPGNPGDTLRANLFITGNGGQRFTVPLILVVGERATTAKPAPVKPALPPAAIPVAARPAAPPPPAKAIAPMPAAVPVGAPSAPPRRTGWPLWLTLTPAVLLCVAVGGAALRDYLAPAHKTKAPDPQVVDSVPRLELRYHDEKQNDELEQLWLTDPQPTMRFGVLMLHDGKEIGNGVRLRRLTFDPWGRTNNTCLRLDSNDERLFGGPKGRWEETFAKTWKDDQDQEHEGARSVWVCDDKKIEVAQFVELVRGQQSQLLDTCRVTYQIVNRDTAEHQVGLRFLLDTFIGGNDGVPFTIPGASDLCDTQMDLPAQAKDKKLPDFLQALEKPDLAKPGTIAHLRLKLDDLESPERVTLGAWPNEKLRVLDKQASGPSTLWNVPLLSMKSLGLNDSAITIYWKEEPLKPGGKRAVGFEYGLYNLASQGSQLAATVDGAFRPNGELTVVAYVNRAGQEDADETVTLSLPEGFKLLEGDAKQPAPKLAKGARRDNVPITWKVQAGPATGTSALTVTTGSGLSQTIRIEIRNAIF